MKALFSIALAVLAAGCTSDTTSSDTTSSVAPPSERSGVEVANAAAPATDEAPGLYDLTANSLDGEAGDLSDYSGKVTLVVNVASRCGYTRQYEGLQELHDELADRGFAVLAFPSNEFGGQEPGSPAEIREFCSSKFGVTFPMFEKCEVKPGAGQSPVYAFLEEQAGETPSWNFCKYLVGPDGRVIAFYKSGMEPDAAELRQAIEKALG